MGKRDANEPNGRSEEAKRAVDRFIRFLLTHRFSMAPDPEPTSPPDIGLIKIKGKRRLRPKKAKDRR